MPFDERLHRLCQEHGLNVVYLSDHRPPGRPAADGEPQVGLLFAQPKGPEQATALGPTILRAFEDLFGPGRIGLAFLQQAGPLTQHQAIRGRLLYLADDAQRAAFEEGVLRDYMDFAYEVRLFDEEAAGEEERGQGDD